MQPPTNKPTMDQIIQNSTRNLGFTVAPQQSSFNVNPSIPAAANSAPITAPSSTTAAPTTSTPTDNGSILDAKDYTAPTANSGWGQFASDVSNLPKLSLGDWGNAVKSGSEDALRFIPNVIRDTAGIVKGVAYDGLKNSLEVPGAIKSFGASEQANGRDTAGVIQDVLGGAKDAIAQPVIDEFEKVFTNPEATISDIHNLTINHPMQTALITKALFDKVGGLASADADAAKSEINNHATAFKGEGIPPNAPEGTAPSPLPPEENPFQSGTTKLMPDAAQGRIDDIAQNMDKIKSGLGDKFREGLDVNNIDTQNGVPQSLIDKAHGLIDSETLGGRVNGIMKSAGNAISTVADATKIPGAVDSVASKAASLIKSVPDMASNGFRYGMSQLTGLNRSTVDTAMDNGAALGDAQKAGLDKFSFGKQVADGITSRLTDLSGLGKEYQGIRDSTTPVDFGGDPESNINATVKTTLAKYGIEADDSGQLNYSEESSPLNQTQKSRLQDWVNQYGSKSQLTPNGFLNARQALDSLTNYDSGSPGISEKIIGDIRNKFDAVGKDQIPGLSDLDAQFAPEKNLLGKLKTEYLESDGHGGYNLKDSKVAKIANLAGKEGSQTVEALQKIMPDIVQKSQIVNALQDIQGSGGIKVGTYLRGSAGAGVGFSGHPIIGAAMTLMGIPEVAVPVLKAFGAAQNIAGNVIDAISSKIGTSQAFTPSESKVMAGAVASYLSQQNQSNNK